jgi:hypothetical protein
MHRNKGGEMTQDEIIGIYKEVSNKLCDGKEWCWAGVGEPLQMFAKLVAEHKREECALICDEHADDPVYCGEAIRARGQA